MGLPRLWDTIREFEEVKPIAQLAEEHYKRHGRPFRIAVDEAGWRYKNVTKDQVADIRLTSQRASKPVEKNMFYRISKLLTLSIELTIVFDGPNRPRKPGRNGGRRIDSATFTVEKDMLRHLGIAYRDAPAEAEAECALMQRLGLVDAVCSEDSDCLLFGCSLWLHDVRIDPKTKQVSRGPRTEKDDTRAYVVRANGLANKWNLDREGLVLFAMLVGGDYNPTGLYGCGPDIALRAIREGSLAKSLCACRSQNDCVTWRRSLVDFLQNLHEGRNLTVPINYPNYRILQSYDRPRVTDDYILRVWFEQNSTRPINEYELLSFTIPMFRIGGKAYMDWIAPVLLTRSLLQDKTTCTQNNSHDVKRKPYRDPKKELWVRRIRFSGFSVSSLGNFIFEGKEGSLLWSPKSPEPCDPTYRVECDYIPAFLLEHVLSLEATDSSRRASKPTSSKRKITDEYNKPEDKPQSGERKQLKVPGQPQATNRASYAKGPMPTEQRSLSNKLSFHHDLSPMG